MQISTGLPRPSPLAMWILKAQEVTAKGVYFLTAHAHFAEGLHFSAFHSVSSSESESESNGPNKGARILEVSGIQSALKNAVCCKECGGPVLFKEELFKREGLCTHPYLFC